MPSSTISGVLARVKSDKRETRASKDTRTHLYKSAYVASFVVGVVRRAGGVAGMVVGSKMISDTFRNELN